MYRLEIEPDVENTDSVHCTGPEKTDSDKIPPDVGKYKYYIRGYCHE